MDISSQEVAQQSLKESLEIKRSGQIETAKSKIQQLLEEFPEFFPGWLELGKIYREMGDRHNALLSFEKAKQLNQNNVEASLELAIEQLHSNQLEESKKNLEVVFAMEPKHTVALIKLGEIYRKQQDRKQAMDCFQLALESEPTHFWANINLAVELQHAGLLVEAEQQLQTALKHYPNDSRILIRLGNLEKVRGDRKQALNWFNQAGDCSSNPNELRDTKLAKIQVLLELNRLDEAVEDIEPILEQWPENLQVKLIFANLLKKQLDWSKAAELYREILLIEPENLNAKLQLAQTLREMGEAEEAIAMLENLRHIFPDDLRVLLPLGHIYREQKDRLKAIECFKKALSVDPTHLRVNLSLGLALTEAELFDEADQQLQTALKHHPQNWEIFLKLGELEQKRHRLEDALGYFQQAREYHPDSFEPSLRIAQTLSNLNQLDRAETELKQLLEKYPDENRIIMQLGYLERQRGRREEALNWFGRAGEITSDPERKKNARFSIIEELRELGRLDEARQGIESMLQQYPEDIRGKIILGSILQQQSDFPAAADLYQEILRVDSKHLNARIQLARILSQSGTVRKAIQLLEETYELLGPELPILMQLAQLAMALEDWNTARKWYREACDRYPLDRHAHVSLANLMFLTGEIDEAFALLEEAQNRLPYAVEIPLKIAELNLRMGDLELSEECLKNIQSRFPQHIPLLLLLSRVYTQAGKHAAARSALKEIETDLASWIQQMEQIRGDIAINEYDYQGAEKHLRAAIAHFPAIHLHQRLTAILVMTGKIDRASVQLKLATEELALKTSPGKVSVPLISHVAKIINEFKIAPPLLTQLMEGQKETGEKRLLAFAGILAENPFYLGAAIYLARELRQQLIFDEVRKALPTRKTHLPSIPKRIIQYWDEPSPPQDVQTLCQSWRNCNPEYEYVRFSFQGAIAFLKKHYNNRVLKAFQICEQPATQADLFRLAYLYKMGGFYADVDDRCRKSLDPMIELNPELVLQQEDFACIGNNFLGCIPGQMIIGTALDQAVTNLLNYSAESPWLATGPGLITCQLCISLLPYRRYRNYQMWPRLLVLSQSQLRAFITQQIQLPYKKTEKSWSHKAYQRRIIAVDS